MTNETAQWWNDSDQIYAVLRGLLRHLHRRALTFDSRTETWLYLAGLHLDAGPWRCVEEADVTVELPFETGLVLVNEMLARLQELSWDQDVRRTIGNVHTRVNEICDPLELEWYEPPPPDADDDL
jgi:hypothetical protein